MAEDRPGDTIEIPRGEAGLSISGLRVSDRALYTADFTPPPPPLRPEESTTALWPFDADGAAWLLGRATAPVR